MPVRVAKTMTGRYLSRYLIFFTVLLLFSESHLSQSHYVCVLHPRLLQET